MVPIHNSRHRHAILPRLEPNNNPVSITSQSKDHSASGHNGNKPIPTNIPKPKSIRNHPTMPNDLLFCKDENFVPRADEIRSHISDMTPRIHMPTGYHRKT